MSTGPNLDEYLKQGIYGPKQTKPEERQKFLGTLRERIVICLTQDQVYANKTYTEVEAEMKKYPNAQLLLNGSISYRFLSRYIKMAENHQLVFKIVHNKNETKIGLVLAVDDAIEKEEIYINDEEPQKTNSKDQPKPKSNKGFFKKLFRKD